MKRFLLVLFISSCGQDCRHDPTALSTCKPVTIGGTMVIGYRCAKESHV